MSSTVRGVVVADVSSVLDPEVAVEIISRLFLLLIVGFRMGFATEIVVLSWLTGSI